MRTFLSRLTGILLVVTVFVPVRGSGKQLNPEQLKTYSTFQVRRTFQLPTGPRTIRFLLNRLDLTCTIIRVWDLESFHAERVGPNKYRARDNAGLKGTIRSIPTGDTRALFVGKGHYRTEALPISLDGKALADIRFRRLDAGSSRLTGELYVTVNNPLIHLAAQVFYPVIASVSRSKTTHLIKIARTTIKKLTRFPKRTEKKLRVRHANFADSWARFSREIEK